MNKIKNVCLGIILILISNISSGQENSTYATGIGLRAGWTTGITVKSFINDKAALEGILGTRYRGFIVTGLYERHALAFNVPGLHWFYGLGAHLGAFRGAYYRDRWGDYYTDNTVSVGIDGILGLEYNIMDIPFSIALDIKPFFDIIMPGYGYWDGALSIRYVF